jgi:hypothetical protein
MEASALSTSRELFMAATSPGMTDTELTAAERDMSTGMVRMIFGLLLRLPAFRSFVDERVRLAIQSNETKAMLLAMIDERLDGRLPGIVAAASHEVRHTFVNEPHTHPTQVTPRFRNVVMRGHHWWMAIIGAIIGIIGAIVFNDHFNASTVNITQPGLKQVWAAIVDGGLFQSAIIVLFGAIGAIVFWLIPTRRYTEQQNNGYSVNVSENRIR